MGDSPKSGLIVVFIAFWFLTLAWLWYAIHYGHISTKHLKADSAVDIFGVSSALPLFGMVDVTPFGLFVWRLCVALWAFAVLIAGTNRFHVHLFAFYTTWNYTMLALYFAVTSVMAFRAHLWDGNPPPSDARLWHALRIATWMCFQASLANCVVIDVVAWTLLDLKWNAFDVMWHLLNLPVLHTEFYLNSLPIVFHSGASAISTLLLVFISFAWLYHAEGGGWQYWFLDYSQQWHVAMYVVGGAVHYLVFAGVWALHNKTGRKDRVDTILHGGDFATDYQRMGESKTMINVNVGLL